ncbi:MAG: hypothetical protein ABIH37_03340 [archaeon]
MKNITTIKLRKETKQRLDKLKEHNRETYEEVIRKILYILNISRKNPEKAQSLMKKIDRTIKSRKQYTNEYQEQEKQDKK